MCEVPQSLYKFLTYLLDTNKKMNLTTITNKEEMISKHIYDSLLISKAYDFKNKTVLDVGSGGGFPGIPLAMLYPTSHFVLLDSTNKKLAMIIIDEYRKTKECNFSKLLDEVEDVNEVFHNVEM